MGYGHTTTAMHDMSTPPSLACHGCDGSVVFRLCSPPAPGLWTVTRSRSRCRGTRRLTALSSPSLRLFMPLRCRGYQRWFDALVVLVGVAGLWVVFVVTDWRGCLVLVWNYCRVTLSDDGGISGIIVSFGLLVLSLLLVVVCFVFLLIAVVCCFCCRVSFAVRWCCLLRMLLLFANVFVVTVVAVRYCGGGVALPCRLHNHGLAATPRGYLTYDGITTENWPNCCRWNQGIRKQRLRNHTPISEAYAGGVTLKPSEKVLKHLPVCTYLNSYRNLLWFVFSTCFFRFFFFLIFFFYILRRMGKNKA